MTKEQELINKAHEQKRKFNEALDDLQKAGLRANLTVCRMDCPSSSVDPFQNVWIELEVLRLLNPTQ